MSKQVFRQDNWQNEDLNRTYKISMLQAEAEEPVQKLVREHV